MAKKKDLSKRKYARTMTEAKRIFKDRTGESWGNNSPSNFNRIFDRGKGHGNRRYFTGSKFEWLLKC